ncbi:MAG: hypothetical protein JXR91_10390 [Deltaproteobacteria bacterium]|nr:hypothetical protein [Deltaproteobacteria bacterium]
MKFFRDAILIIIAIGLVVAVLLPSKRGENAGSSDIVSSLKDSADAENINSESSVDLDKDDVESPLHGFHEFFPVQKGVEWVYLVDGPQDIVTDSVWTLKIESKPSDTSVGIISSGFGKNLKNGSITISENKGIILNNLPFSAPYSYLDNIPLDIEGEFLPPVSSLIKGAVWKTNYKRRLKYRNRLDDAQIVDEVADSLQTDLANVSSIEKVIVPAGIFSEAYRVEIISRIEMDADGKRKVLNLLTVEPYKTEIIWFVKGIGIVKRRISYTSNRVKDITFVLKSFHHN